MIKESRWGWAGQYPSFVIPRLQDQRIREAFLRDERITAFSTRLAIDRSESDRMVVLVSKDTNIRMKAIAWHHRTGFHPRIGLKASMLFTKASGRSKRTMRRWILFYADTPPTRTQIACIKDPISHENFIVMGPTKSVLATYHKTTESYQRVDKKKCFGISPRNAEQSRVACPARSYHQG